MKPIKEQYKEIVCGFNDKYTENVSNKCTEIADDYAIEFAKWCLKKGVFHQFLRTQKVNKDLLEIFKKEKGL